MQLSYHAIPPYQFYSIPESTYERIISRSKRSVYLYHHNDSQERFAVKEIPYSQHTLKIYQVVKEWEHLESLVKIRGISMMVATKKDKHPTNIEEHQNTNHHLYHQSQYSPHSRDRDRKCQRTLLIWMEYYPINLYKMIQQRRKNYQYFTKEEAKQFLLQMLTILEILQQNNFSHRDIKPQNILCSGDRYRLCDFDQSIVGEELNLPIQPTTIAYTSPMFLHFFLNNQLSQIQLLSPYKMDLYALGLTFLVFCSMGKFKPEQRLNYTHDIAIHEQFIRQQRRKYIKDSNEFHEFNVIVKIMLEKDEFKRDDFKMIMLRVKQGISGFYINSDNDPNFKPLRDQEDLSTVPSQINKINDLKKSVKRGKLGGTIQQGNFLLSLIIITLIIYILLFFTES